MSQTDAGPRTAEREIRRLLIGNSASLCLRRDAALRGSGREGVHDMRVAARRLRAVADGFAPSLRDVPATGRWMRALRELLDALGGVRDLDVHEQTMSELLAGDAPVPASLLARLFADRVAARQVLDPLLDELEPRFIAPLAEMAAAASEKKSAARMLSRRLRRRVAQLSARVTAASSRAPELLHDVRKTARKVRYLAEIGATIFPDGEAMAKLAAAMKKLQGTLGQIHDYDLLLARIPALDLARDAPGAGDAIRLLCDRAAAARAAKVGELETLLAHEAPEALASVLSLS